MSGVGGRCWSACGCFLVSAVAERTFFAAFARFFFQLSCLSAAALPLAVVVVVVAAAVV